MARKPDVPCGGCGKLLWSAKGSLPNGERACRECRRNRRQRSCQYCGELFLSNRPGLDAKFCSLSCGNRGTGRGAAYMPQEEKLWRTGACTECAAPVVLNGNRLYCDRCSLIRAAERDRSKCRARRALKRGSKAEKYTLAEIAERDESACQLCGGRVAMAEPFPRPNSPTIDHIVPIVKGGDDTRANVQLAHFLCNSRKGDRPMVGRLALVA